MGMLTPSIMFGKLYLTRQAGAPSNSETEGTKLSFIWSPVLTEPKISTQLRTMKLVTNQRKKQLPSTKS